MKNVLILNGHQYVPQIAEGNLTKTILSTAKSYLEANGYEVKETHVEDEYTIEGELEKIAWADCILFQYPVFWMSMPWIAKKYFDEVLNAGCPNVTYVNDGRSREDTSTCYGSGGVKTEASYMLSLTYNCPASEFDNKEGFFDGLTLDEANVSVHKIFQFLGMKPLKTYSIHDIYKGDMDIDTELARLTKTLEENFPKR